jgi:hypothetical protein
MASVVAASATQCLWRTQRRAGGRSGRRGSLRVQATSWVSALPLGDTGTDRAVALLQRRRPGARPSAPSRRRLSAAAACRRCLLGDDALAHSLPLSRTQRACSRAARWRG